MNVTIGETTFDRVSYDVEADVLYLGVGDPRDAARFEESAEGHALRYDAHGRLVGMTIVNARALLDRDGAIVVTPPQLRVEPDELAGALVAA
jgi:YD repeat-containing protein